MFNVTTTTTMADSNSNNNIIADIRSLCKVISLLLQTPKETANFRSPITNANNLIPDYKNTHDKQTSPLFPVEKVEILLEEVKQTLRKHLTVNNETIAMTNQQQQHTEQLTFLLNSFEKKIIELKSIYEKLASGHNLFPDSSTIDPVDLNHQQLFRFMLINALTHSVVGIYNLITNHHSMTSIVLPQNLFGDSSIANRNNVNQCVNNVNLFSTKEESLIRLAIGHTMQIAFFPSLKCYLTKAETLFPTSINLISHFSATLSDHQQLITAKDELLLLKPIYLIYIKILMKMSNKLESNTTVLLDCIRRDCYSTLIACFSIYRRLNRLNKNDSSLFQNFFNLTNFTDVTFIETEAMIRKQFEQYIAIVSIQEYVIR